MLFPFVLSVLSGGRIDYLPGARRPWIVDWDKTKPVGRGKTLVEAIRQHLSPVGSQTTKT